MFSSIVMEIPSKEFEAVLDAMKKKKNKKHDVELNCEELREIIAEYKKIYKEKIHEEFPQDCKTQLYKAIEAVFRSWNNPRAVSYRRIHEIRGLKGTAVNIVTMVFGNMGNTSGTGVAFTRDPNTGEKKIFGEVLMNA